MRFQFLGAHHDLSVFRLVNFARARGGEALARTSNCKFVPNKIGRTRIEQESGGRFYWKIKANTTIRAAEEACALHATGSSAHRIHASLEASGPFARNEMSKGEVLSRGRAKKKKKADQRNLNFVLRMKRCKREQSSGGPAASVAL